MFVLKRVEIDQFWGRFDLKTDLLDSANVFIGRNGTGKTTLIQILQGVLTANLDLLKLLEFKEVRLWLADGRRRRKLSVTKGAGDMMHDTIRFQISQKVFPLPMFPSDFEYRLRRLPRRLREALLEVRRELEKIVNISWIPVHRGVVSEDEESYRKRRELQGSPVDKKLEDLMESLKSYQLQLESEAGALSRTFQRDVLECMLYDENFDKFTGLQPSDPLDLSGMKDGLLRAYKDLGALDESVRKKIATHISMIRKSVKACSSGRPIKVDDLMPLSLLKRADHIVGLSQELESAKKDLFKPVTDFLETLRKYMSDKQVVLDSGGEGGLRVRVNGSDLPVERLSSGEKQLLILFTETLLQRRKSFIFITDEPELSLHVAWQRRVLKSIQKLNPNSQIIVATHSPEVAGALPDNIIRMEDITSA